MLNFLNFFEDATQGTTETPWVMYIVLGVLFVGMILMMVIPNKRQKKKAEEMMSKLTIGSKITTIGGIIGEVVQLDDKYIWILTGVDGQQTTMQLLRQAIHSIDPAEGSPEAKEEKKEANEEDEIR